MALQYPLNLGHMSPIFVKEGKFQASISSFGSVGLFTSRRCLSIFSRTDTYHHLRPGISHQIFSKCWWINTHKKQKTVLKASNVTKDVSCDDSKEGGKAHELIAKFRGKSSSDDDDNDEHSDDDDYEYGTKGKTKRDVHDPELMSDDERREWRKTIREVLDKNQNVEEAVDPIERKKKMEELLANYPLVVDEDDPDWPEDADGWGFNFNQFFNKITIKNVKKDDDEDYDSDKEVVWQDDNYIRPIKDISTEEWEETVFKDISPLIILVHNRYKRPKQNEKMRDELEKAVQIFWNSGLPSPRCVAIDAVVEDDLASALGVSIFPELLFTKAGKILYREKVIRTADEFSRIMAFFYYGAAEPPFLNDRVDCQDPLPLLSEV